MIKYGLPLGPLTQDETLHLLAALGTGHPRPTEHLDHLTDLGQWLFRETHRQPFYLVETLRVLLERQILTLHRSREAKGAELNLASLSAARQQSVLAPNVRRLILSQVELANEVGGILSAGIAQPVWGQSLARLSRWEEAETHLAASVHILLSGQSMLESARTRVAWGLLCRDRGDLASAQGYFLEAASQFETSGLTSERETVQSYLAQMGHS
jgi:hypothetical protein